VYLHGNYLGFLIHIHIFSDKKKKKMFTNYERNYMEWNFFLWKQQVSLVLLFPEKNPKQHIGVNTHLCKHWAGMIFLSSRLPYLQSIVLKRNANTTQDNLLMCYKEEL